MEQVKQFLLDNVANANLKTSKGSTLKLEQRTRNNLKNQLNDILVESLAKALECQDIMVVRTEKGVGIAVDNEKVGFVPIEINVMFKDLENDISDMAEEYQDKLKAKAEKAEQAKKAKAQKMAQDKADREAKAKAKAEAEAQAQEDDLDD